MDTQKIIDTGGGGRSEEGRHRDKGSVEGKIQLHRQDGPQYDTTTTITATAVEGGSHRSSGDASLTTSEHTTVDFMTNWLTNYENEEDEEDHHGHHHHHHHHHPSEAGSIPGPSVSQSAAAGYEQVKLGELTASDLANAVSTESAPTSSMETIPIMSEGSQLPFQSPSGAPIPPSRSTSLDLNQTVNDAFEELVGSGTDPNSPNLMSHASQNGHAATSAAAARGAAAAVASLSYDCGNLSQPESTASPRSHPHSTKALSSSKETTPENSGSVLEEMSSNSSTLRTPSGAVKPSEQPPSLALSDVTTRSHSGVVPAVVDPLQHAISSCFSEGEVQFAMEDSMSPANSMSQGPGETMALSSPPSTITNNDGTVMEVATFNVPMTNISNNNSGNHNHGLGSHPQQQQQQQQLLLQNGNETIPVSYDDQIVFSTQDLNGSNELVLGEGSFLMSIKDLTAFQEQQQRQQEMMQQQHQQMMLPSQNSYMIETGQSASSGMGHPQMCYGYASQPLNHPEYSYAQHGSGSSIPIVVSSVSGTSSVAQSPIQAPPPPYGSPHGQYQGAVRHGFSKKYYRALARSGMGATQMYPRGQPVILPQRNPEFQGVYAPAMPTTTQVMTQGQQGQWVISGPSQRQQHLQMQQQQQLLLHKQWVKHKLYAKFHQRQSSGAVVPVVDLTEDSVMPSPQANPGLVVPQATLNGSYVSSPAPSTSSSVRSVGTSKASIFSDQDLFSPSPSVPTEFDKELEQLVDDVEKLTNDPEFASSGNELGDEEKQALDAVKTHALIQRNLPPNSDLLSNYLTKDTQSIADELARSLVERALEHDKKRLLKRKMDPEKPTDKDEQRLVDRYAEVAVNRVTEVMVNTLMEEYINDIVGLTVHGCDGDVESVTETQADSSDLLQNQLSEFMSEIMPPKSSETNPKFGLFIQAGSTPVNYDLSSRGEQEVAGASGRKKRLQTNPNHVCSAHCEETIKKQKDLVAQMILEGQASNGKKVKLDERRKRNEMGFLLSSLREKVYHCRCTDCQAERVAKGEPEPTRPIEVRAVELPGDLDVNLIPIPKKRGRGRPRVYPRIEDLWSREDGPKKSLGGPIQNNVSLRSRKKIGRPRKMPLLPVDPDNQDEAASEQDYRSATVKENDSGKLVLTIKTKKTSSSSGKRIKSDNHDGLARELRNRASRRDKNRPGRSANEDEDVPPTPEWDDQPATPERDEKTLNQVDGEDSDKHLSRVVPEDRTKTRKFRKKLKRREKNGRRSSASLIESRTTQIRPNSPQASCSGFDESLEQGDRIQIPRELAVPLGVEQHSPCHMAEEEEDEEHGPLRDHKIQEAAEAEGEHPMDKQNEDVEEKNRQPAGKCPLASSSFDPLSSQGCNASVQSQTKVCPQEGEVEANHGQALPSEEDPAPSTGQDLEAQENVPLSFKPHGTINRQAEVQTATAGGGQNDACSTKQLQNYTSVGLAFSDTEAVEEVMPEGNDQCSEWDGLFVVPFMPDMKIQQTPDSGCGSDEEHFPRGSELLEMDGLHQGDGLHTRRPKYPMRAVKMGPNFGLSEDTSVYYSSGPKQLDASGAFHPMEANTQSAVSNKSDTPDRLYQVLENRMVETTKTHTLLSSEGERRDREKVSSELVSSGFGKNSPVEPEEDGRSAHSLFGVVPEGHHYHLKSPRDGESANDESLCASVPQESLPSVIQERLNTINGNDLNAHSDNESEGRSSSSPSMSPAASSAYHHRSISGGHSPGASRITGRMSPRHSLEGQLSWCQVDGSKTRDSKLEMEHDRKSSTLDQESGTMSAGGQGERPTLLMETGENGEYQSGEYSGAGMNQLQSQTSRPDYSFRGATASHQNGTEAKTNTSTEESLNPKWKGEKNMNELQEKARTEEEDQTQVPNEEQGNAETQGRCIRGELTPPNQAATFTTASEKLSSQSNRRDRVVPTSSCSTTTPNMPSSPISLPNTSPMDAGRQSPCRGAINFEIDDPSFDSSAASEGAKIVSSPRENLGLKKCLGGSSSSCSQPRPGSPHSTSIGTLGQAGPSLKKVSVSIIGTTHPESTIEDLPWPSAASSPPSGQSSSKCVPTSCRGFMSTRPKRRRSISEGVKVVKSAEEEKIASSADKASLDGHSFDIRSTEPAGSSVNDVSGRGGCDQESVSKGVKIDDFKLENLPSTMCRPVPEVAEDCQSSTSSLFSYSCSSSLSSENCPSAAELIQKRRNIKGLRAIKPKIIAPAWRKMRRSGRRTARRSATTSEEEKGILLSREHEDGRITDSVTSPLLSSNAMKRRHLGPEENDEGISPHPSKLSKLDVVTSSRIGTTSSDRINESPLTSNNGTQSVDSLSSQPSSLSRGSQPSRAAGEHRDSTLILMEKEVAGDNNGSPVSCDEVLDGHNLALHPRRNDSGREPTRCRKEMGEKRMNTGPRSEQALNPSHDEQISEKQQPTPPSRLMPHLPMNQRGTGEQLGCNKIKSDGSHSIPSRVGRKKTKKSTTPGALRLLPCFVKLERIPHHWEQSGLKLGAHHFLAAGQNFPGKPHSNLALREGPREEKGEPDQNKIGGAQARVKTLTTSRSGGDGSSMSSSDSSQRWNKRREINSDHQTTILSRAEKTDKSHEINGTPGPWSSSSRVPEPKRWALAKSVQICPQHATGSGLSEEEQQKMRTDDMDVRFQNGHHLEDFIVGDEILDPPTAHGYQGCEKAPFHEVSDKFLEEDEDFEREKMVVPKVIAPVPSFGTGDSSQLGPALHLPRNPPQSDDSAQLYLTPPGWAGVPCFSGRAPKSQGRISVISFNPRAECCRSE